jgi:hypothetical protein
MTQREWDAIFAATDAELRATLVDRKRTPLMSERWAAIIGELRNRAEYRAHCASMPARLPAQLDIDGRAHDIAPAHERMRLFEPAPNVPPGQSTLDRHGILSVVPPEHE